MLRMPGYMTNVQPMQVARPVSSFFKGYEAATDRAYKEGASQLARETLEYNKKKLAEDARLRQEELQRKKNKAKAQAQENALYKYIDDAREGNVPIGQIQQQVNQMYDNSSEYREMLGQPKIQVTPKGRVVMTETGMVTQEKLDDLLGQGTIDQDFYDQAIPNIGKEYTFDYARNPQGGFIPMSVKFEQAKKEEGQSISVNNLISALNSLLRQTDKFTGKPIFTLDQALTELEKINPNARQMLSGAGAISGEGTDLELNDINEGPTTGTSGEIREFNTEEEFYAANLPKGTIAIVNGRKARMD